MPGGMGRCRELREFEGVPLELPGVAAFLLSERDAHLPRQIAAVTPHPRDVRGEVHLRAADRDAAEHSQIDAFADDVLRTAARTAERVRFGGDGHDQTFGFDRSQCLTSWPRIRHTWYNIQSDMFALGFEVIDTTPNHSGMSDFFQLRYAFPG
jgi:hypothetical protein